ncbi:FG-GAP-like repeat-containing protein [Planctomicrobium sp. SH664]|uniref:FG-GAP-like repeat-containing protein n=1 Tax=Planctomicrobium sp. SH664 TaxID=3448125 RepID=UPI003F5AE205
MLQISWTGLLQNFFRRSTLSRSRRRRGARVETVEALESRLMLTVNVSNAAIVQPVGGTAQMVFTLTRDGSVNDPLGVQYATRDGSAKQGVDYLPASGVVYFAAGEATTQVSVTILNNKKTAPQASLFLDLQGLVDVTPQFAPRVNIPAGDAPSGFAVGDFNGDGRGDLVVVANENAFVIILRNTTEPGSSTPTFASPSVMTVAGRSHSVAVGDYNGDGRPDLAIASLYGGDVAILLNSTDAGSDSISFRPPVRFNVGSSPFNVEAVDMNQDGLLDLVAIANPNLVSILVNQTEVDSNTPSFLPAQQFLGPDANPRSLTIADFNGDGKPDVASSSNYGKMVSVLLNTTEAGATTLSMTPRVNLPVGHLAHHAASGDLNGDGKPDIVVTSHNDLDVNIYTNLTTVGSTDAVFEYVSRYNVNKRPEGVALVDVTNDGKLDIVVTLQKDAGQEIAVFRNITTEVGGTPLFADAVKFRVEQNPFMIVVHDFDGDGLPDLAVSNNFGDNISILLNRVEQIGDGTGEGRIVQAPVITGFSGKVTYKENAAPLQIAKSAKVTDKDSANFNTGVLRVSITANGESTDLLSIKSVGSGKKKVTTNDLGEVLVGGVVIGTFLGGHGDHDLTIQFNANATADRVTTLLRAISFSSSSDNPSTLPRTVQVTVSDADGAHHGVTSTPVTKTINVTAVNDLPVIQNWSSERAYHPGGEPLRFGGGATLADADSANFDKGSLRVDITSNRQKTDVLLIQQGAGLEIQYGNEIWIDGSLIGRFSGGTNNKALVIQFTAAATPPRVQQLLQSITFSSPTTQTSSKTRKVRVTLNDGDGRGNVVVNQSVLIFAPVMTAQLVGREDETDV